MLDEQVHHLLTVHQGDWDLIRLPCLLPGTAGEITRGYDQPLFVRPERTPDLLHDRSLDVAPPALHLDRHLCPYDIADNKRPPDIDAAIPARPGDNDILKPDLCKEFPRKLLKRGGVHRPEPLHKVLPHLTVMHLDLVGEPLLMPPGQPDVALAELLKSGKFPPFVLPLNLGEDTGIHRRLGCQPFGLDQVKIKSSPGDLPVVHRLLARMLLKHCHSGIKERHAGARLRFRSGAPPDAIYTRGSTIERGLFTALLDIYRKPCVNGIPRRQSFRLP